MHVFSRAGGPRVIRPAAGSAALLSFVLLLVLATALPAFGAAARKLSEPSVSPRNGTTATTVVFEVTYTRPAEPDGVHVLVAGATHAMTLQTPGAWNGEDRFRWAGTLPAGTHDVVFKGTGVKDLEAGSVTITAPPSPTPKPSPTPTPEPTPKPTPRPSPTPEPTPKPTPKPTATARPSPTPAPSTAPRPSASPSPTDRPQPSGPASTATPNASDPPGIVAPGSPEPSATPAPAASEAPVTGALPGPPPGGSSDQGPDAGSPVPPATGDGLTRAWSPEASLLATLGLDAIRLPPMGFVPALATTSGVATMAMAFSFFGKRRRSDDDDDPTLGDRAAQGVGVLDPPFQEAVAAALAAAPEIPDLEAGMPRWRRPSLLQARKADPIRDAVEAPRLTFDNGLIGPIDGRERHYIKYNVVTLLDAPDEIRANGIGVLTEGDEVQLLEKRGVYWHVLCPDGSQGWIHKMTIGGVVGAMAPMVEGPRATMPAVAESWTLAEDDVDDDVLSAYLDARRRGD